MCGCVAGVRVGLWGVVWVSQLGRYWRQGRIMTRQGVFALPGAALFMLMPGRLMHAVVFG